MTKLPVYGELIIKLPVDVNETKKSLTTHLAK